MTKSILVTRASTMIVIGVFFVVPTRVAAGLIEVFRVDTDHIVIPVFDSSLGTLTGVQLTVQLLPGETAPEVHGHDGFRVVSSNVRLQPDMILPPPGRIAYWRSGPLHHHNGYSPSYSGGGISIGSFYLQTSTAGIHNHDLNVISVGHYEFNSGRYRAWIDFDVSPHSHYHTYSAHPKVLEYFGSQLDPFLASEDITIEAGEFRSSYPLGPDLHIHRLYEFFATDILWRFPDTDFTGSDDRIAYVNPRFTTTTVFHYEPLTTNPIPEPASIVSLSVLGALGLAFLRIRQKRTAGR